MPPYDYGLSSYPLPCSFYQTYSALAEETIFQHVTPDTTPEQYAAAMQELERLAKRLQSRLDIFHFPAESGPHRCVRDALEVAESRLRNLQIMHVPAQPPAPKQQLITSEGVVIDLEGKIQTNTTETDVGTEDSAAS